MVRRSKVFPCKFCEHPIFFDDAVLSGRPLEYDEAGHPNAHSCQQFKTTLKHPIIDQDGETEVEAEETSVVASKERIIEELVRRVELLEARLDELEG